MITKEQAINADEFHWNGPLGQWCRERVGPRNGVTFVQERWRRNGKTQTWVTRPDDFRIPVKHGLYTYGNITQGDASDYHAIEDCPLLEEEKDNAQTD